MTREQSIKQAKECVSYNASVPPDPDAIHEIPLDQIRPAPWNPAGRMDQKTIQELADSIALHGQQIPCLVRPIGRMLPDTGPIQYEIVFGHRRLAAQALIAENDGKETFLRSFIRPMSEEDAMILSGIENLQRQGFSDIEEAEFFRAAGERYGESAVKILAEKLSVSDRYIRKRIEILKLPESALKLWRGGTWHVGHMEQLLRVDADQIEPFIENVKRRNSWHNKGLESVPVYQLKEYIEGDAITLSHGRFDKEDCKICRKNTQVQLTLFDFDKGKGAQCLDQKCFCEKQQGWFDLHWISCKINEWGTQKAVVGDISSEQPFATNGFSYPAHGEKCATCPDFATEINLKGEIRYGSRRRMCTGDRACYARVVAASRMQNKSSDKSNSDKSEASEDGPRVEWHGEHFRQAFYAEQVPELVKNLLTEDPRRLQIALACFVYEEKQYISDWFWTRLGLEVPRRMGPYGHRYLLQQFLDAAAALKPMEAESMIAEACVQAAFRRHGNYADLYDDADRTAIAEFVNIDFKLWAPTPDWFEKKTKPELVRYIVFESGLLQEPKFCNKIGTPTTDPKDPRLEKLFSKYKKSDLVLLIKECGVDLHGRLPAEIEAKRKRGGDEEGGEV